MFGTNSMSPGVISPSRHLFIVSKLVHELAVSTLATVSTQSSRSIELQISEDHAHMSGIIYSKRKNNDEPIARNSSVY
jgi:hypothetical protein